MRFLVEENVEAYQWNKNGDHPKDNSVTIPHPGGDFLSEGEIVRRFIRPDVDVTTPCGTCNKPMQEHGWIESDNLMVATMEGYTVCPGEWIRTHNITHTQGGPEKYEVLSKKFNPNEYSGSVKCMEVPKVEEMEALKARLLWYVIVDDKPCPVYDVPNRHHWHAIWNGGVSTWWLKMGGSFHPWPDRYAHRICFEYILKEYNRSKYKWDEMDIRKGVTVTINANGKPFLSFGAGSTEYAFAKAQQIVVQAMEHPYNFLNPEEEKGRKIYFYGLPATVRPSSHAGEIGIVPDYSVGVGKSEWWRLYKLRKAPVGGDPDKEWADMEAENTAEHEHDDYINWGDALSDGNINWFRKDKTPPAAPSTDASIKPAV